MARLTTIYESAVSPSEGNYSFKYLILLCGSSAHPWYTAVDAMNNFQLEGFIEIKYCPDSRGLNLSYLTVGKCRI